MMWMPAKPLRAQTSCRCASSHSVPHFFCRDVSSSSIVMVLKEKAGCSELERRFQVREYYIRSRVPVSYRVSVILYICLPPFSSLSLLVYYSSKLLKTLESPLDCKEIQPVHSKGDQPWVFFGSNDAKAETPVLWPPHVKSWLIGKHSDAGRDWGQEEKGMTEDEMAGWHHQLDGHEFEWTSGNGDGQGGLACCDSWGCKELDMTEQLNWTERDLT